MADILQAFSNPFFLMKIVLFWFRFVPNGPINNKQGLIQIMTWCLTVNKPNYMYLNQWCMFTDTQATKITNITFMALV